MVFLLLFIFFSFFVSRKSLTLATNINSKVKCIKMNLSYKKNLFSFANKMMLGVTNYFIQKKRENHLN